jgi:MFS family permease
MDGSTATMTTRYSNLDSSSGEELSHMARAGVAGVVFGFTIFLIGMFPVIINLDLNPGVGILQLITILFGIGVMALGGYIYAYATRHRTTPHRLREQIGLRLMGTGYIVCAVSGLADVLGIGSHNIPSGLPYFGLWQSVGLVSGLLLIVVGVLLYAQRYSPGPQDKHRSTVDRPDSE